MHIYIYIYISNGVSFICGIGLASRHSDILILRALIGLIGLIGLVLYRLSLLPYLEPALRIHPSCREGWISPTFRESVVRSSIKSFQTFGVTHFFPWDVHFLFSIFYF
jgi:hypothetical protein